ncbi:MAG TPA: hypothetical protein VD766_12765, partial [Solirubrobacterales bacterium]|nr:hypothetical protein [Solirubrobacterales bacterium]
MADRQGHQEAMMNARTVFLVAMGVIGLHIADDSFFQPQPGTSAGDHLISGPVPLGAMALAVVAYLKGNEGIRGAVALIAGFCGLVAAAEAVYYTAEVGPSGDDFTGLLCVPAGVALIALGVHTLWSSRRRSGRVAVRVARRSLATVGGVFVLLLVLAPLG